MVPIYEQIMDQIKAAVIIGELPKPGCITGMKAKFKVLTALSHEAQLLILDEPTGGLG